MTVLKILGGILIGILLIGIIILSFFTIVEYRPKPKEDIITDNNQELQVKLNQEYCALTFNIGYGSLGKNEDFAMDGGKRGIPDSKAVVEGYLAGIKEILNDNPSDIYFLQEVDLNSRRSYKIDQRKVLSEELGDTFSNSFAYNYKALFVPFPFSFTNYMGKVESGILNFIKFNSEHSERHQFPKTFAWPVKTVNLKRCMLINYLPIENSDKYLVAVNIHLSAYDTGKLRNSEMEYLKDFLIAEREKGNYVIVGGDFNQTFPQVIKPIQENIKFNPIKIEDDYLPEGYEFAVDPEVWTSRLLNQPYNPSDIENTYYFIIDGFIVSSNIEVVEVKGLDLGFVHSDHNPVSIKFILR
ncbi:MAG: endonuclease/exonuclease/phosphatase family protein [Acholeplasmataceae bacterium]|jgi:endonuclease/exonuclease/phosphatase family metal-dependent hydrolase